MPFMRMTAFFELGDVGWSESVHCIPTDPATLRTLASNYVIARTGILTSEAKLVDVRVSDDLVFRDIVVPIPGLPRVGAQPGRAASPSSTVLVKAFTAEPTVQRNIFLRGIPASLIDGRNFTPPSIWDTSFLVYASLLQGGQFQVKAKNRTAVKQGIQSATVAGEVNLVAGSPGFVNGDQVQLLGIPRSQIRGREFTVYNAVTLLHFFLRPWQITWSAGPQGFLRKNTPFGYPITLVTVIDIGERKAGRPFGVPRGRSAPVR